jgi:anoctamin-10/anoctamin-7
MAKGSVGASLEQGLAISLQGKAEAGELNPITADGARARIGKSKIGKPAHQIEKEKVDRQIEKEGYSWDYVMAFKNRNFEEKKPKKLTQYQKENPFEKIVNRVKKGGLQIRLYTSVDQKLIICKIRCPLKRMKIFADKVDYRMKLDHDRLRKTSHTGIPSANIGPIIIKDEKDQTWRSPYDNIYGKYDTDKRLQPLYTKYGSARIPFRSVDRLKLTENIIGEKGEGGCGLNIFKELDEGTVKAFFPLHEDAEKNILSRKWIVVYALPGSQPFGRIKDYFGEKIALYFAWLGHYTSMLGLSGLVGLATFILARIAGTNDTKFMPAFGLFMCLWSSCFGEFWKRKNNTLSMEWGMQGFEEEEQVRPQFDGQKTMDPVTGEDEFLHDPPGCRRMRLIVGLLVVLTMVSIVAGVVASIFLFDNWSKHNPGPGCDFALNNAGDNCKLNKQVMLGPYFAQGLNSVSIMVMNSVYGSIAIGLTSWENHRTDTAYEDMLTAKVFCFEFINSYGALFYIAFFQSFVEGSEGRDYLDELSMALGVIFISLLIFGNVDEILIPYTMRKFSEFTAAKSKMGSVRSDAEVCYRAFPRSPVPPLPPSPVWIRPHPRPHSPHSLCPPSPFLQIQYGLADYEPQDLFDDYQEMILQYGYTSLFVTAFPLAPLAALMNNYFEIRVDAYKLCSELRRPDPRGAEDIGTWYTILEIMGIIAVITNAGILCFTSHRFTAGQSLSMKVWIFLIIEHAAFAVKFIIEAVVEDVPEDIQMQLERQDYLVTKLIMLEEDDDDEELMKGSKLKTDLTLHDSWK